MNHCLCFLIEYQILFSKVSLKFAEYLTKKKEAFFSELHSTYNFFLNKGKSQRPLKFSEEQ